MYGLTKGVQDHIADVTIAPSLGNLEESSHGVFPKQWWSAVSYLNGSDPQRPHICSHVVVILRLLLTRNHLEHDGVDSYFYLLFYLTLEC